MATNKEVEKKQKDLQTLREKIAVEEEKAAAHLSEAENDVTIAQLEREEAELNARLDSLKEQNKVSTQRAALKDQVDSIANGPDAPGLDAQTIEAEGK